MVNRAFADRYLAGRPSVSGFHLANPNANVPPGRIAGLVGNVRERGLDQAPGPTVYFCSSAQAPTPYFLVRTQGDPAAIVQAVRLKLKELEPLRAVYDIAPLEDRIGDAFAQNRLRTILLALFAATALSIACVGLYGTVSYAVSRRRRESALRLALGAMRRDIVRQFLTQGLRVAGAACGVWPRALRYLCPCTLGNALRRFAAGSGYALERRRNRAGRHHSRRSDSGSAGGVHTADARAARGVTHVLAASSREHTSQRATQSRSRTRVVFSSGRTGRRTASGRRQ